jgi:hypothetical protein
VQRGEHLVDLGALARHLRGSFPDSRYAIVGLCRL